MLPLGELKLIGALVLVAGMLFAVAALVKHEKAATHAEDTLQATQQALTAVQAVRADETRVTNTQAENLHEQTQQNAMRAADARDLDAAVQRVRDNATAQRLAAAQHPAASGSGQGIGSLGADVVPRQLYLRELDAHADAESDLRDLADYAADLKSRGQLCERDYSALTP